MERRPLHQSQLVWLSELQSLQDDYAETHQKDEHFLRVEQALA
jgi:hypothetical protein